ncbi:hypothetical protein Tco_1266470, partial [Tanacetum coccineum]
AARFDVLRTVKSNSDDEEEYVIKRNNVWKKAVSFLGSLPVPLKQVNWKPNYKGSYTKEEEATGQWRTEIRLTDPYGNGYLQGFTTKKMDHKLSKYHKVQEHTMTRPDHHDPNAQDMKPFTTSSCCGKDDVLNRMGCDGEIGDMLRIRVHEVESDEELFTLVAWIRAFNINEPIYAELCLEFYSTYKYDEVCAGDELQTKKIIMFRLGARAHSLTLLEFSRRLGLYQVVDLEEDGFNVYFEGGLRNDDNFNAQNYWLSISREDNLSLSRSHTSTIKRPILRVIHKMITYGLCQRTTGYDKLQKNDLWLLSMFDARHQNGVLTEDVERSLSALVYYRDLDSTTLRDLIDSDGKLIFRRSTAGCA